MWGDVMCPKIENPDKIIEQMENLSESEKEQLAAIFNVLIERQENLFANMKQDVKKELDNKSAEAETIDIYTALIGVERKSEMKGTFSEIYPNIKAVEAEKIEIKNEEISSEAEYSCGIVFWNSNYANILKVQEKQYTAKVKINSEDCEAKYRFRQFYGFVEKEKEIQSVSIQYQIETPLIYNPMARRALELLIQLPRDISKEDTLSIDFCFEEKELNGQLILNSTLLWNLDVKEWDELKAAEAVKENEILPLWDKTFQTYRFPANQGEFILVENGWRAIKRVGEYIYWQCKDEGTEMEYKKYQVHSLDSEKLKNIKSKAELLFHNDYEKPPLGEIERIRTQGDARRAISVFQQLGVEAKEVSLKTRNTDKCTIFTYPKRLDYYQIKDGRLAATSVTCRILFEDNPNDTFYIDKVSYILAYMNHRYPEYKWIGVS
jgi:hypothetical protein